MAWVSKLLSGFGRTSERGSRRSKRVRLNLARMRFSSMLFRLAFFSSMLVLRAGVSPQTRVEGIRRWGQPPAPTNKTCRKFCFQNWCVSTLDHLIYCLLLVTKLSWIVLLGLLELPAEKRNSSLPRSDCHFSLIYFDEWPVVHMKISLKRVLIQVKIRNHIINEMLI